MADVYIDGIWRKTADWYSEKAVGDATVFTAENLPDGKHLLGILTRGGEASRVARARPSTGRASNTSPGPTRNDSSLSSGRGSIPTCRCGWTIGASLFRATWAA